MAIYHFARDLQCYFPFLICLQTFVGAELHREGELCHWRDYWGVGVWEGCGRDPCVNRQTRTKRRGGKYTRTPWLGESKFIGCSHHIQQPAAANLYRKSYT